jgi:MFS family permease
MPSLEPARVDGRRLTLAASCLAMLAVGVNGTAVMAALPAMQSELGLGPQSLQWIVNAYLVASAVCIILGGKLADRFGAARAAVAGVLVFAIASVTIAAAPDAHAAVAGRGLQGIGAALAVPATLAAASAAPPSRRAAAIGAWTGFVMLGFSLGPLVGGAITHFLGWRVVFWSNTPIMLLAALGFLLESRRDERTARPLARQSDWLGFALLAIFMTSLIFGLQAIPSLRARPGAALGAFAVAAAALASLQAIERRQADPLVDFGFFARRAFALGAVAGSIAMLGIITFLLYYNLFAQGRGGLRLTPVDAGVSLLPMSVAILGFALAAPALAVRYGLRFVIGGAMALVIAAAATIAAGIAEASPVLSAAGLFAMGAGLALPYACAPRLALSVLDPTQAGQGSGIISACTFLGGSVGVAAGGIADPAGGFFGVLAMLAVAAAIGVALSTGIPADDTGKSRSGHIGPSASDKAG